MPDDTPNQIQLPTVWIGAEDLPVLHANAFVGVVHPHEVFLNIGSIVPPAILGDTLEEREKQARALTYIPVKPIARLAFSPSKLDELIQTLQTTRTNYETLMENLDQGALP